MKTSLLATFNSDTTSRKARTPCRFYVKGKGCVRTRSGKTVWNMVGHCRGAINNHLEHTSEGRRLSSEERSAIVAAIPVVEVGEPFLDLDCAIVKMAVE